MLGWMSACLAVQCVSHCTGQGARVLTKTTVAGLDRFRTQELCGSRPGLPVPNKPDGFFGRKAALKLIGSTGA